MGALEVFWVRPTSAGEVRLAGSRARWELFAFLRGLRRVSLQFPGVYPGGWGTGSLGASSLGASWGILVCPHLQAIT